VATVVAARAPKQAGGHEHRPQCLLALVCGHRVKVAQASRARGDR
jgi:hypothetical protein